MTPQDLPPGDAALALSGPGPEAIRRALRGPPGRVALRLAPPADAARRRVALALLEEAGASRSATVLESPAGDLVLTEAAGPDAARAEALLSRLFGTPPQRLRLPEDLAPLAALPGLVPALPIRLATPPATGIEALADAAPLPALLRRHGVMHIAAGTPRRLALLGLRVAPAEIAAHLGPSAADPDLMRHALDRLRPRLLARLTDPPQREALLGFAPPVPIMLDLPTTLLPDPPPAEDGDDAATPALIAVLSLAEALEEGLAERRAPLRQAGWGIAVRGLDAAALALLSPEALPADLLLLRWSAELAGRGGLAALRRTDPARLVLTRCDGPEALEWGLSLGIARYEGPWIDALMAATRMGDCRHAAGCTRAQCAARGAAADRAGREGCADPQRLGALVPA